MKRVRTQTQIPYDIAEKIITETQRPVTLHQHDEIVMRFEEPLREKNFMLRVTEDNRIPINQDKDENEYWWSNTSLFLNPDRKTAWIEGVMVPVTRCPSGPKPKRKKRGYRMSFRAMRRYK